MNENKSKETLDVSELKVLERINQLEKKLAKAEAEAKAKAEAEAKAKAEAEAKAKAKAKLDLKTDKQQLLKKSESILKQVQQRSKDIDNVFSTLTDAEKEIAIEGWTEKYGLTPEQFKTAVENIESGLKPSQIFNNLGILPIEQMISITKKDYPLADLVPVEIVKNGVKMIFYADFKNTDELAAYEVPDDYVGKLYQTDEAVADYETFFTNYDIHKGLLMPDSVLNDFTNSTSIWMAIFENVSYQLSHSINKKFYELRLKAIVNPLAKINTATDWSSLIFDKTISANTGYDLLTQLKIYFSSLKTVSRSNLPDRYKVANLPVLETAISVENCVLIVPNEFTSYVDTQLRAGAFNQKQLDLLPELRSIDYSKTFAEYGLSTNVKQDLTDFVAFLVPKNCLTIIEHYEATRSQNLLVLYSVIHTYFRLGLAVDKNHPIYNISLKLTSAE